VQGLLLLSISATSDRAYTPVAYRVGRALKPRSLQQTTNHPLIQEQINPLFRQNKKARQTFPRH